jgi:hypothetical protein
VGGEGDFHVVPFLKRNLTGTLWKSVEVVPTSHFYFHARQQGNQKRNLPFVRFASELKNEISIPVAVDNHAIDSVV